MPAFSLPQLPTLAQLPLPEHMELLDRGRKWFESMLADLPPVSEWVLASLALVGGLLMLLYGLRIFKALVIIQTALSLGTLGYAVVAHLIERPDLGWVGMLVGGLAGALLAWPLLNFFISLWGALMGAAAGALVADALGAQQHIIVGLIIGGLAGGLLMLIVFRLVIIVLTSLFGSALTIGGLLVLVIRIPQVGPAIRQAMEGAPLLAAAVVVVPAAIGIAYQLRFTERRDSRNESEPSDSGGGRKKG